MFVFKVYARVDERGRILEVGSSAFLKDLDGWIEIDQGSGDRYQHAQGNYLPKPVYNWSGIPIYKMEMGEIKERSEEEIRADIKPPEKTDIEKRFEKIETAVDTVTKLLAKLGVK